MEISVWALIFILLVFLIGAAMQRVAGMGLGLLGAPVMSILVGPVAGVLIINVLATFNAVTQTISVRKNVDWKKFWLIGPVMLIGSIPGAWVVHHTPIGPLQIIVGGLVLLGLGVTTYMPDSMRRDGNGYAVASGIAGGFMNTLAGIAGPAITVYAQASRWPQRTFGATLQPLFLLSGGFSLLTKELSADQSIFVQAPWYLWPTSAVALIIGLAVGKQIAGKVSFTSARKLAIAVAAAGAAVVLIRGLIQVFTG